jgi:hypothetical protein
MKRSIIFLSLLFLLVSVPFICSAEVNVNVQVGAPAAEPAQAGYVEVPPEEFIPEGNPTPPPTLAVQNPELVVVPSGNASVYMVPNMAGVYFYGGTWYRFHHGVWFRAGLYSEPWVMINTPLVPSFVVGISPAYALYLPPSYHRIHYGEFHSHWRTWDRERRWERESWYRNERRAEIREARERRAHERMATERRERAERIKADKVGYKDRMRDPGKYNKPIPSKQAGTTVTHKPVGPQKPGQQGQTGTFKPGQQGQQGINKPGQQGGIQKPGQQGQTGTFKPGEQGQQGINKPGQQGGIQKPGQQGMNKPGQQGGIQQTKQQPKMQQQTKQQPKMQQQPKQQPKVQQQPKAHQQPKQQPKDNKQNIK